MGEDEAPAASKGFQVGVRAGLGVPFAKATENAKMSDTFSPQFRVGADIGVKLTSEWFLGGYVGLGLGGTAGGTSQACDAANVSCGVATFQLGVEGQYHFLPNQKINPWIGYGIGWEFSDLSRGSSASSTFSGPDFMHLMGGADFRISRTVAMGPFLDTSLGVYNHASTQNGGTTVSTSLQGEKTVHGWVSLGVHVVFFP